MVRDYFCNRNCVSSRNECPRSNVRAFKVGLSAATVVCNRVTQDMLLQTAVTRGMVYEYEDNLAEKKRMELEILHRN